MEGGPDLRSPARRNADALVEAMRSPLDEGDLPSRGRQCPHLVLTMRLTDLIEGLGSAVLDTGGRISAAEARRLACDACIVPMMLGSDSMPLDVGREQRLATAALRDALAHRDRGCSFPGCDPPRGRGRRQGACVALTRSPHLFGQRHQPRPQLRIGQRRREPGDLD